MFCHVFHCVFNFQIDGQGYGCIFDAKWSPDGLSLAATDSHGYYLNIGFGSSEVFKKVSFHFS